MSMFGSKDEDDNVKKNKIEDLEERLEKLEDKMPEEDGDHEDAHEEYDNRLDKIEERLSEVEGILEIEPEDEIGKGQTYGEMSADIKNIISHRSRSLAKLQEFLLTLDLQE